MLKKICEDIGLIVKACFFDQACWQDYNTTISKHGGFVPPFNIIVTKL